MRVLVVGATGFLGVHVVRALEAAGHSVQGTGRVGGPGLIALRLGEVFPEEVVAFGPEAVVDLAWEGIPDFSPERCTANVAAQRAFIEQVVALEELRRLVVMGTCREYGDAVGVASGTATPVDDFGRAKDEVHRMAADRCREAALPLTWLRVFYAFGPGQRSGSLLPMVLEDLRGGCEPRVRDRSASHDFVAVTDVAAAVVASLASTGSHDVADLGSGSPTTVGELVDLARGALGVSTPSSPPPGPGGEPDLPILADVDRTERVLGWRPTVTLESGIRHMADEGADETARLPGSDVDRPEST